MRIVLVGTAYPLRGGIAHYVALLYRKLEERGHKVTVLSFKRQYPSFLFPGETQKDEGAELIPIESFPILDSINPLSWVWAFFWLKKIRPDLLIFKYWMPFFAPCYATVAFLAKVLLGARIIYICDNIVPHERKIGDHVLSLLGLRFVDFFIVQSETVLKNLLLFRHNAIYRKIPHPIYEIFPPPLPKSKARKLLKIKEERVLLYFGYVRAYKGLRYLIKAMPEVIRRFPVRLLVCGDFYEGREEIMAMIDDLNLKNRITVQDRFIPNEEVGLYFCASDLVVLPYITATQSGIVKVAYYYDRPVVVTHVGGLPEVVPDNKCGYVVPPQDSDVLARAIITFYEEKKGEPFTKNVRIEKKKYSWDRMADAIEELMKSNNGNRYE